MLTLSAAFSMAGLVVSSSAGRLGADQLADTVMIRAYVQTALTALEYLVMFGVSVVVARRTIGTAHRLAAVSAIGLTICAACMGLDLWLMSQYQPVNYQPYVGPVALRATNSAAFVLGRVGLLVALTLAMPASLRGVRGLLLGSAAAVTIYTGVSWLIGFSYDPTPAQTFVYVLARPVGILVAMSLLAAWRGLAHVNATAAQTPELLTRVTDPIRLIRGAWLSRLAVVVIWRLTELPFIALTDSAPVWIPVGRGIAGVAVFIAGIMLAVGLAAIARSRLPGAFAALVAWFGACGILLADGAPLIIELTWQLQVTAFLVGAATVLCLAVALTGLATAAAHPWLVTRLRAVTVVYGAGVGVICLVISDVEAALALRALPEVVLVLCVVFCLTLVELITAMVTLEGRAWPTAAPASPASP